MGAKTWNPTKLHDTYGNQNPTLTTKKKKQHIWQHRGQKEKLVTDLLIAKQPRA
jgi:hypothetical protein